jgi:outer membrane lipoprotein-sorting protein
MKTLIRLICIYVLSVGTTYAQTLTPLDNPTAFIQKMKQVSASTQTIKADFIEEKTASYLKEPQKSSGVFYYKKNNNMRWERKQPNSYILLIHGDKAKLKEDGKEKDISTFNAMIGKIKDLMMTLVSGDFHDSKAFTPQYFQTNSHYIIKLTPKNKRLSNLFTTIDLSISKSTYRVNEIMFNEKSGDKNVMKFYNDVVNVELAETLFTQF